MGKVCWNFPLLTTGDLSGSNNAAITMFKESEIMDSLAREVCQNSLDARDEDIPADQPVKVKFQLFELVRDQHSMFKEFGEALQGAIDFWNKNNLKTEKIRDFLEIVSHHLDMEKIPVLMMSDYNTTGLNRDESPRGEISYWELLVNTEGISIKQNKTSGGSYGIGKNAPFAYSGLSTVFYNTLAKDGGRAFQGVAHLVTTQKEYKGDMLPTYPSGKYLYLINEVKGRPILPEDQCSLAEVEEFKRTEVGTDVAIFGFKTEEYPDWEKSVAVAVIKNFILAIHDGKLEIEIASPSKRYEISKHNLETLLFESFKDVDELTWTRQIYETVTKTEAKTLKIAEEDDLSIYVRFDDGYTPSLSRFRSTGMLINTTDKSLPHYAVVVLVNDVGDMELSKTLRAAEPPQHTEWAAKHIVDNTRLRTRATKYIRDINKAVKKILEEFDCADITDRMDAGIGNYLPDASGDGAEEGTDGLRTDVKISAIVSNDGSVLYENQYESAASSAGSKTRKSGLKAGDKKRKKRTKNRIPVVIPTGKGDSGVSAGAGKVKISSLSLSDHRTFHLAGKKYRMVIHSLKAYDEVYIQFHAGRDDGKQEVITIENVKMNKDPLMEVHGEKLGPISIEEGRNELYLEFENDEIMAVIPTFTLEVKSDEEPNH